MTTFPGHTKSYTCTVILNIKFTDPLAGANIVLFGLDWANHVGGCQWGMHGSGGNKKPVLC
jgi:hypothetical protein